MKTKVSLVVVSAGLAILSAGCGVRFSRGPYLMSLAEGQVDVRFRLAVGSELPPGTVVEVLDGSGGVLASARPAEDRGTYVANLRLAGKMAAAAAYRLSAAGQAVSGPFAVALPRAEGPTRLAVYGDSRTRFLDHAAVARAIGRERGLQGVFHTGDFVTDGEVARQWDPQFFGPARAYLTGSAIFPVLGNHEGRGKPYFEAFGIDPDGGYYARRIGGAHLIVVDLYQKWAPGSGQYAWLERELASVPAGVYKIVLFHEPPFSVHPTRGHSLRIIRDLVSLFDRAGVDLVFCGHHHHYVRSAVMGPAGGKRGTTYVTTGGGGAPRHDVVEAEWCRAGSSRLHYVLLEISPTGRLSLSARATDGQPFDHYEIASPGSQAQELAYSSLIERQLVGTDLARAVEDSFLIAREVKRGQAVAARIALPLKNASPRPLRVELAVRPESWKVDLPQSKFTVAPGGSATARIDVAHDGKTAAYPTPHLTCDWSLGSGRARRIEAALFLSVAPEGVLSRVEEPLVFDGMLTEKFWTRLPKLGYLLREDGRGLAANTTDIHVAAGRKALYVAVECQEEFMDKVRARAARFDDARVWQDDCVELFIEPTKGSGEYYQMVVSITGRRFDAKGKQPDWSRPWEAKVLKAEGGWSFEARIPWSTLGLGSRPGKGRKLGFNVGRTRNAVRELSQWSRIPGGDSHTPEKFGTLVVK